MISVIMPAYNTENKILEMLNSIARQTYKDYELIVVNDGSTDKTLEVCNKFKLDNSNINMKIIDKKNGGVSSARNIGIENINKKSEYIIFVDSDDLLEHNMFEVLIKNIKEYDYVICNYYTLVDNQKNVENYKKEEITKDNFIELYNVQAFNPLWNKIFRTEIILRNNIRFNKDLKVGEDLEFVSRYIAHTRRNGIIIPDVLYNYFKINSNSNFKIREDAARNCIQVNDLVIENLNHRFNFDKITLDRINLLCVISILRRYKLWLKSGSILKNYIKILKDFKKLNLEKYKLDLSDDKNIRMVGKIIKLKSFNILCIYFKFFINILK